MHFLTRLIVIVLALIGWTVAAQPAPVQRIVAVGDLHGDYAAFSDIVKAAGLTDDKGRWIGGKAVLVQLGDVPDRGPDTLKIVRSLMRLEKEAAKHGGKVIALVGNHEAMNMAGDLRYIDPGEYAAFADQQSAGRRERAWQINRDTLEKYYAARPDAKGRTAKERWFAETPLGKLEHRRAWSVKGEVGKWIVKHDAVALIGGVVFAHGGLSVEAAARPREAQNRAIRSALKHSDEEVLYDPLGPLWYRGNVDPSPAEGRTPPQDEAARVLAAYGADRLVVAHTPQAKGITTFHGGRVICVDTGISAGYGGPRSFLEILGGRMIAHERAAQGNWTARELPQSQGDGE